MDDFRRKPVNRVDTAASVPPAQSNLAPPIPVARQYAAPKVPLNPNAVPRPVAPTPELTHQPIEDPASQQPRRKPARKKSWKKGLLWTLLSLVLVGILAATGIWFWYNAQLGAVDPSNDEKKLVAIVSGSTPAQIAKTLKDESVIRSESAFLWYTRLNGTQNSLQAGTYRLSPSETTPEVVEHLTNGNVDTFNITFLPGATLQDNREVLIKAGYSEAEVDAALAKNYESPLFAGKPASADLEGYIFGETYSFGTDATVESILERTFEQFYSVVEENDLIEKFQARNQTLFQGITMASIVQREASPGGSDMADIAQVFYNRLAEGMNLGSDVTYQYAADKEGVARDTNLDSPYNTRIKPGLPPGPIAAPGAKALIATATPSGNNYLFFLSGDDDVTYYGRTVQEHEANIRNHCQKKCQII